MGSIPNQVTPEELALLNDKLPSDSPYEGIEDPNLVQEDYDE